MDWVIPAPSVSRLHVRLWYIEGTYWIEDLGSSNGTYVNGTRLEHPVSLQTGDLIGLGQAVQVSYEALPESPPAPAASDGFSRPVAATALEEELPLVEKLGAARLIVSVAGNPPKLIN